MTKHRRWSIAASAFLLEQPTMSIQPTEGLTAAYPAELEPQIAATVPGQASFAEGGPFATKCGECVHLNDKINKNFRPRRLPGCLMYFKLRVCTAMPCRETLRPANT
jgi:hypothetical protein